jgi:hypothetical protein
MAIELTKDECALILDGLAQLPLAKAYNTFQKVLEHYRAMEAAARQQAAQYAGPVTMVEPEGAA